MRVFESPSQVLAAVGEFLGASQWRLIDQQMIDDFADVTGDHQWIHCDVVRAKAGPFGTTIAHGYLTLSMIPTLMQEVVAYPFRRHAINYGLEKVRFPAPVPAGSRVRAVAQLASAEAVPGGLQVLTIVTIEIEGGQKPACVAQAVSRHLL